MDDTILSLLPIFFFAAMIWGISIYYIFKAIIKNKHLKDLKRTEELSPLYLTIQELNSKYNFYKAEPIYVKNIALKSKRSLDNFNIEHYFFEELENDLDNYINLIKTIEQNKILYDEYMGFYKSIESYTSIEEFRNNIKPKISYKSFRNCEKQLYKDLLIERPVCEMTINIIVSYTSPTGRNHYERATLYKHNQIKKFINTIIDRQQNEFIERERRYQQQLIEKERKAIIAKEKRAKEKKLRNLEKYERSLIKKEESLNKREDEFITATKEHIYAPNKDIIIEKDNTLDQTLSLIDKLKLLMLLLTR